MDTNQQVAELKIAKVGKDRKRKGAGLPMFGGGSNGGGLFSGAVGGSGSAAAGAGLLGKVGVLALIGTLSAGAWQVGKSLRPDETAGGAKPKIFASTNGKYADADLANVIKDNRTTMPNSLGYVSGSMDGMTPEERARKEAEAAEAARATEEEAKKAEAEAAKEPADVAGSPAGVDPNSLLKGMTEGAKDEKAGAFGKKFGALSSSFGGGGLAGGTGLAGGVNRGFQNVDLANKGSAGKMASMRGSSNPSISKAAKARPGASNNKGFARRQLSNAYGLSRQAVSAGKGETSAQSASQAFDNNSGAGSVISGPGVSAGNGGAGVDAGGSVNPNSSGGSAIDPDSETANVATPAGKNVTPYQSLIIIAQTLMALVAIISAMVLIFKGKAWFEAVAPGLVRHSVGARRHDWSSGYRDYGAGAAVTGRHLHRHRRLHRGDVPVPEHLDPRDRVGDEHGGPRAGCLRRRTVGGFDGRQEGFGLDELRDKTMANDNDLDDVNDGAPAVDIPDLKKKEKERKKAGAAWGSAKPGGSPFGAATGGSGAAARSAASAASSAAGSAAGVGSQAAFSGASGWLSTMLATTMGKALFGLGAFAMIAGAGLVGLAMLRGGGADGSMIPSLGGISSSLKIDRAGGDRTAITGKGDIRFDPLAAQAAKKEEPKVEEKTAEAPADVAPTDAANEAHGAVAGKDKLAHNLAGAKLTSNLGGGFGNKDIFAGGNPNAPKFNTGLAKANLNIPKASNGKIGAMKSNARTARASKMSANRAKTQRAFGQLKVARGMSALGAGSNSAEGASRSAADAFDQGGTNGGELSTPGGPGMDGTTTPGGPGAPDLTSVPDVPDTTAGYADPRMDQAFKNIEKMAAQAGKMKMMGMALMAIGVALMIAGAKMLPWGAILIALGAVLLAIGLMLMQQANQMAAMAKQIGSALANQYGTGTYQEQAVNECTDQVLANGGGSCSRETYQPAQTTVQQDVVAERETPVTMEGNGGPVP